MMRLYVTNNNNEKITLQYDALTRTELAELIGGKNFIYENQQYSVNDVKAEADTTSVGPAAIGAALGVLGGGIGIAIGGAIGAFVGEGLAKEDLQKAAHFNES